MPDLSDQSSVMVVDDDAFYLEVLCEHLEHAGYTTVRVGDGRQAWALLQSSPDRFNSILLDRVMPHMDGIELLTQIKRDPQLSALPVIMQTGRTTEEDVLEGLQAGAYYYLTKPFESKQLLAVVNTATSDYKRYRSLQCETQDTAQTLALMEYGKFTFRTLKQGRDLVTLLCNSLPNPSKVVVGLSELVTNAIEHGNLGISYDDKSRLNELGTWQDEIERRLSLHEYADKQVHLSFQRLNNEVSFTIQDQGDGFEWMNYLEIDPMRAFDTHGRGIPIAKLLSFDRLEYLGKGNRVVASVVLARD